MNEHVRQSIGLTSYSRSSYICGCGADADDEQVGSTGHSDEGFHALFPPNYKLNDPVQSGDATSRSPQSALDASIHIAV